MVRGIKLCQRRLCGRLFLIAYSSVVNLHIHGDLEGLRSLILKATSMIRLICACIELRMFSCDSTLSYCLSFAFGGFQFLFKHGNLKIGFSTCLNPMELCFKLFFFSHRLEQFNDILVQENVASFATSSPLFDLAALNSVTSEEPHSIQVHLELKVSEFVMLPCFKMH